MKRKKTGLTLVEMLVVLGIIAILVGVLLPAMTAVKNHAKETKQKAQFSAINLALITFKNDYGDYPPSNCPLGGNYSGAQKLAESLLGWDLLGFHPKTSWRADGYDGSGGSSTYDPQKVRDIDNDGVFDTLKERKSPYLDTETANVFKLGYVSGDRTGLFPNPSPLASNTYVLCDVFNYKQVILSDGRAVNAGSPVLYYKANTSQNLIRDIYNVLDNDPLVYIKEQEAKREQPLSITANNYEYFYNYIRDPKIEAISKPYRPDSYILISAGLDGVYGTADDIRNFGN
ncbi:MAG: prepilin-type N-terminal cleavage/methylation domain-containing protein [Sedimentisphaerales bacterium]|nr:prepilin-type N-terminal cleavage/methylation domain-containing protein [Sedimentisphaerales bacterium]